MHFFDAELFRGDEKEKPELYRQASPIRHVSKDNPPLLLVHGEQDDLVPFEQSSEMAKAYERAGLEVEFIPVKNAGHDFEQVGPHPISPLVDEIHERTIAFSNGILAEKRPARQRGSYKALHCVAWSFPLESARSIHSPNRHVAIVGAPIIRTNPAHTA